MVVGGHVDVVGHVHNVRDDILRALVDFAMLVLMGDAELRKRRAREDE